jgi:hypothetical protein
MGMKQVGGVVAVVAVLLLVGLVALMGVTPAQAGPVGAPLAIPTPVSVTPGNGAPQVVNLLGGPRTADGAGPVAVIAGEKADIQWVIDQGVVNTATLKLQFSNDGVHWVDGATFVSNNAVDAGDMQQFAVFGRYLRAFADVTNGNAVTVTVVGLVK